MLDVQNLATVHLHAVREPRAASLSTLAFSRDPVMANTTSPAPQSLSDAQLLSQLQTPIEPIEESGAFTFSVALVALIMVGVMLVYAALVLASFGFTFLLFMLVLTHPLWLIAALLSGVFSLFLVKPIFAPASDQGPIHSLDPVYEARLFAFVAQLCNLVGAPQPKRIDVVQDANAAASFRRGFFSLFSDDLVLTIGLPLVSGLNLRQFTGVLAHEFGHFTQGSAMRFSYLINSINNWFARVVFERDAWDEHLDRWAEKAGALGGIAILIRLLISLTRWILLGMMYLGNMISCNMMRQMEYDADQHEARVAGSDTFISTSMQLPLLMIACERTKDDVKQSWREDRLGDNFVTMVQANVGRIHKAPKELSKIRKSILEAETGLFDTHPSTSDRIAQAKDPYWPGVFQLNAPAKILFRDFDGLSRALTLEFYKWALEDEFSAQNLVPSEVIVAEQNAAQEALDTLYRYFQGEVLGTYEVFPPQAAQRPPEDAAQALRLLRDSRERMIEQLAQTRSTVKVFDKADDRVREITHAKVCLDCGFTFPPDVFGLASIERGQVMAALTHAKQHREQLLQQVRLQTTDAVNRLVTAIRLMLVPQVARRIEASETTTARTRKVLVCLAWLEQAWPEVLRLRDVTGALQFLATLLDGSRGGHAFFAKVERLTRIAATSVNQIRTQLAQIEHPYPHAKGTISIGQYACHEAANPEDFFQTMGCAMTLLGQLPNLYFRLMAELTFIAEKVESAAGLPPLPEPPPEPEEADGEDDD